MKKNIFLASVLIIILISCKDEKFDNRLIDPYSRIGNIMSDCYIQPSDSLFNKRINEIFKTDISSSSENEITLGALGMFPEFVIKNSKYVLPVDFEPSIPDKNSYENIEKKVLDNIFFNASKELCSYNKMLFYNDKESTEWIQENYPIALTNLVTDYGYTANDDWLRFTFYNTDVTQGSDDPQLHKLLFDFECEKPMGVGDCMTGKYTLRQDMIDKMIALNFMSSQIISIVYYVEDSPENYTGNTETLHLYLMALSYKFMDGPNLRHFFNSNKKYFEKIEAHNYFEFENLKDFIENFEISEAKLQGYGLSPYDPDPYFGYGVINDPDGYTNLRDGEGTNYPVVKKIIEGEKFAVKTKGEEWWLVILKDGTQGWIHNSRVTLTEDLDN